MQTSKLNLIWASKPGCTRPVAELWIDDSQLWLAIFIDDKDDQLKIEVFRHFRSEFSFELDLIEAERLIEYAKSQLLSCSKPSPE